MTTTNLAMTKPTVGGDSDVWGGELNTDLDLIDTFAGWVTPDGQVGAKTWTPIDSSGAGLSFTVNSARYFKIGPLVFFAATITYPATASGANATIGGLPATSLNIANSGAGSVTMSFDTNGAQIIGVVEQNTTTITVRNNAMAYVLNSTLSAKIVRFQGFYWSA